MIIIKLLPGSKSSKSWRFPERRKKLLQQQNMEKETYIYNTGFSAKKNKDTKQC